MDLLIDAAWGTGVALLAYGGGIAGIMLGDARARRRGDPVDAGMFPLTPDDPDYWTGIRCLDGPGRPR